MIIRSTLEFNSWISGLTLKSRSQVDDRLDRIREHSHFGDRKSLGDDLFELRWQSGRRLYYSTVHDQSGAIVLLLLGGEKNGQKRDIAHARRILDRDAA